MNTEDINAIRGLYAESHTTEVTDSKFLAVWAWEVGLISLKECQSV